MGGDDMKNKTIKINDNFEITSDKYQWILTQWSDGIGKKGENKGKPIRVKRESYYGRVDQACNEIVNREAKNCETLAELSHLFKNAVAELTGYVEGKL